MKGDIPIILLLMVALFVVFVFAMYMIFGAPKCDSMANVTAIQLKTAIDEVSRDSFPMYNSASTVPTDPTYYKTVPIKLCQAFGEYSYFLQFWGGMPEYQIYYEVFPEGIFTGGAGLWSESYPWSGGAGSMLLFWGAVRGAVVGFKYVSLAKVYGTWSTLRIMKNVVEKIKLDRAAKFAEASTTKGFQKILQNAPEELAEMINERDGHIISGIASKVDAEDLTKAFAEAGYIQIDDMSGEAMTFGGRYIINGDDVPSTLFIKEWDQSIQEFRLVPKPVYVKKDAAGKIIKIAFEPTEGLERDMINPAKEFKAYIEQVAKTDPDQARLFYNLYEFPENTPGVNSWTKLSKIGIKNTKLYKNIYEKTVGRIKNLLKKYEFSGYNVKKTIMTPEELDGIGKGLGLAIDQNPKVYDKFVKPTLRMSKRASDRIRNILGKATTEELTEENIKQFLNKIDDLGGIGFLHRESIYNMDRVAANNIKLNPNMLPSDILDEIKKLPDFDKYFSTLTDDQIKEIIYAQQKYIKPGDMATGKIIDTIDFEKNINKEYFLRITDKLESSDPLIKKEAAKEFGMIMGFLEKSSDTLPVTKPSQYAILYGKREIRKLVIIDGRAFLTPNSWIAKGWALTALTGTTCLGNSICLYSRGVQQEFPFYLEGTRSEEEAELVPQVKTKDFFIRAWRPVNPVVQVGGIQAALMHVPEHPRFHVVSPCFAIAKIWKTKYNGEYTIFIKPEKCDMGDKASNYCYADENLINSYYGIWLTSDIFTFVEIYFTAGQAAVWKTVVRNIDPVTLGQAMAEAAISWPGYPFSDLTYTEMQESASKCGFGQFEEELRPV